MKYPSFILELSTREEINSSPVVRTNRGKLIKHLY